jgi:hypothetical protein
MKMKCLMVGALTLFASISSVASPLTKDEAFLVSVTDGQMLNKFYAETRKAEFAKPNDLFTPWNLEG